MTESHGADGRATHQTQAGDWTIESVSQRYGLKAVARTATFLGIAAPRDRHAGLIERELRSRGAATIDHRVPQVPEDIRQRMANAGEEICAPIGNTYGTPTLTLSSTGWTLGIRDWGDFDSEPVSEQFAAAWIAEFGGPK